MIGDFLGTSVIIRHRIPDDDMTESKNLYNEYPEIVESMKRVIADPLFGSIDRVTETILSVLNDERNPMSEFDNMLQILSAFPRKFIHVLRSRGAAEKIFE